MPRATQVLKSADRAGRRVIDTLILPFERRQAKSGFVFGVNGTCVEFDFAEPVLLRTDDALALDDGSLVEVVAEPEPVLEARLDDGAALARLAWHLGDRHVPVEVKQNRLRVRREPELEALLQSFGAKIVALEAPFEPDGGAHAAHGDHHHAHHHDHGHAHGHDHHHHDHPHDHPHDHKHHR
ncbi:MAG TPA: urease accessory protein UreE [Xanthobacteraceae bacterium]|nr:urease accessory protein UreE [Xanthobacteraceae bacterium]